MGDCNNNHMQLLIYLLVLIFLFITTLVYSASGAAALTNVSDHGHVIGCIDAERRALHDLKQGFTDPSGRLSSWRGEDCCKWLGVRCSDKTGHVVMLNLTSLNIGGEIRPSLLHLKHLHHLDLSYNIGFEGIGIPKFIGSLKHLRYLNFFSSGFSGAIPPQLGNLSSLVFLNLENNDDLRADSLHWLSGLTSLRYLYMGGVNLTMIEDGWLDHVNMLPSLQELYLDSCELQTLPSSLSFVNFTSLRALDLSYNYDFNTSLPHWLMGLHSLSILDLSKCGLHGHIPDALGALTSLQYLGLGGNHLNGKIPKSLRNLCHLRELYLHSNNISGEITDLLDGLSLCPNKSLEKLFLHSNQLAGVLPDSLGSFKNLIQLYIHGNNMSGSIPESIGRLSKLVTLGLSLNFFEGFITESHFTNLSILQELDLCSLSAKSCAILNVTSNWVPPFTTLRLAYLANSPLGPLIPSWLLSQKNLEYLNLRNTSISGTLDWVWKLGSLVELDLSLNKIKGGIHLEVNDTITIQNSTHPLVSPPSYSQLKYLQLKGNMLSGSIPSNIGRMMPDLEMLDLSMNNIKGTIPSSICEISRLRALILSNNTLTGDISQWCRKDCTPMLSYVDLSYNHLTGKIPTSLIVLRSLETLKLSNNGFYGELASMNGKQSGLMSMDLGENNLTGKIPSWIGNGFPHLKFLRLHSNHFASTIPLQICAISSLQVLDLGGNELSGTIPRCFSNISAMAKVNEDFEYIGELFFPLLYGDLIAPNVYTSMTVYKGIELEISTNLRFLRSIDLSNNNLSGDLPQELTELVGLSILNLSRNHFEGMIPEKIGKLERLESLDLSHNQLSGPIPQSITSLGFLNHLSLSYNNLKGRIPSDNHLQTLSDQSPIYEGNPELCGPPLTNKCEETTEGSPITSGQKDEEDEAHISPFYISMLFGSIIGFWGIWGALILKKSWRHAYFRLVDDIVDRIYVFIAIKMNRMQGWM